MGRPLRSPALGPVGAREVQVNPPGSEWLHFNGTAQLVGTSPSGKVTVYVDPTLGAPALQNARDLLADADRVVNANDALFGTKGGPVKVIVFALYGKTDGTGGADHGGCDYASGGAIEVCASFGNSARASALFEAELSECSMGGNLCGESTGEALSRWCASVIANNALADFATAPTWMHVGAPDFVNTTDPTDQNAVSTGCGMAFLSWLLSTGHPLNKIAPAMVSLGNSGTFAQLYALLTGDSAANAWPKFQAALKGLPAGVTSDDPFKAAAPHPAPGPGPHPAPGPGPHPAPGPGPHPAPGPGPHPAPGPGPHPAPGPGGSTGTTGTTHGFGTDWVPSPSYAPPPPYSSQGLWPPPPPSPLGDAVASVLGSLNSLGRSKSLGVVAISGLVVLGVIAIAAIGDPDGDSSKGR